MSEKKGKVFIGLSGGVDSSVSAALLQRDGYDVVGVFIKVWQADFLPCTWREERRDAMRAAAHLNIPFLTLDLEKEYKQGVVDYMIAEYSAGRVPNPDVMCNKHVKFGAFLEFAKRNGADFIATGHYARVEQIQGSTLHKLMRGVDQEKDQSYFLWTLTQKELSHTLFPVGHLKKNEVRELAREFGLANAEKKDSQGLCFMGRVDMRDFLKHYLDTKEGDVLDMSDNVIGKHDGAILYTIGQRHGFQTQKQRTDESPLYVVSKDIHANTITVNSEEVGRKNTEEIEVISVNDIHGALHSTWHEEIRARIRHRGTFLRVRQVSRQQKFVVHVDSDAHEDISAGQSIVFFDGDTCLGGGIMSF